MPKGKKQCVNCYRKIGFNTYLCDCGWYYPEGVLRKDLLQKKQETQAPKYYDTPGRGRKECPGCHKIVGGVLKTCYCNFDFSAAKKEKDEAITKEKEEKELARKEAPKEKMSARTAEMMAFLYENPYEAPVPLTKGEHAERILGLGKKRAKILLQLHEARKCWVHVDWDLVRKGLAA